MSTNPTLIAVEGPTAVGKTATAIAVAQAFDTEIISADARQVYRQMEIGTAAPTSEEQALVPHRLVGFLEPEQDYSAGAFERDALAQLEELFQKRDWAVLAGGSGLYVKALLNGLDHFPDTPAEVRAELNQRLQTEGLKALQDELAQRDPVYWETVDRHNPMRIIRALEVCLSAGKPYSAFRQERTATPRPFKSIRVALELPREELYDRINRRVTIMMEQGLLEEARALWPKRGLNSLETVGYKELFDHFEGKLTLEEAVEKIRQHSRNYAKRQTDLVEKTGRSWVVFTAGHPGHNYVYSRAKLRPILTALRAYRKLESHILYFVLAEFFVFLVNASFFLILNIYLSKQGYADQKIASFISYRFLTVMLLSVPLGILIKRRRLKPFMYIGGIIVPLATLAILHAIRIGSESLIYGLMIVWGTGFFMMRVLALPYILRNCKEELHSEALAVNFIAWSSSMLVAGFISFSLSKLDPILFTEENLLTGFSFLGLLSLFFISRIKADRLPFDVKPLVLDDLGTIGKALLPTFMFAVGAGLTIQFMNLFFLHTFGVDYGEFSLMGSASALLVTVVVLGVPSLKHRYGYRVSITLTQTIAVCVLILLATTAFFSHVKGMVVVAGALYIMRQPLQSMANPLTSELTMYYVGEKNRELTSALTAAIWSGSWFFSSLIFGILRANEVPYPYIFYITAFLYAIGVVLFYRLIGAFERKSAHELILESINRKSEE